MAGLRTAALVAAATVALVGVAAPVAEGTPPRLAAYGSAPALGVAQTFDHTISSWGPTTGTDEAFSTPAVGDIDGDGVPEVVVAGNDGVVTAWTTDGRVRWSTQVGGPVLSSPTLADVNGDGRRDVVVGTMSGTVVEIDGPSGRILRTFTDVPSEACAPGVYCKPRGFFATPVVVDLDGGGRPEIVAPSWDHQVYAWHADGRPVFRTFVRDTIWSSPTVADLYGDGRKEIVFGGDRTGSPDGGYLWMLESDGSLAPGFPKVLPGQVIWSSPSVADIDGDHRPDIVVGTGLNYPAPAGQLLYAFDAAGQVKPGWPVPMPGRVMASPAVGDVNGDGRPDVVAATEGGWVVAVSGDGTKLWQQCNRADTQSCATGVPIHGQAVIADVDADGHLDVVSALEGGLRVLRGRDGAIEREGSMGAGFAPVGGATVASVGGSTWIVQSMLLDTNGSGRRDAGDILRTWAFTTGTALGQAPWPTFRHDAARSGADLAGTEPWYPFASAAALVGQQYQDLLGRSADPGGAAHWTAALDSRQITAAQLVAAFLASPEFGYRLAPVVRATVGLTGRAPTNLADLLAQLRARRRGTSTASIADAVIAADPVLAAEPPDAFVAGAYRSTWGASPTAVQAAAARRALAAGASRGTVLVGITDHPWAQVVLAPVVDVTMVYVGMLRRLPEAAGAAYWVQRVRRGTSLTDLAAQVQYSAEYALRFR